MASRQKIVISLPVCDDRSRSRAMKIAATADGTVTSISIQGADRDHLVVIGEGIDSVNLTKSLRKKFPSAGIVSVQPITSSPERSTLNRDDYNTYRPIDYLPNNQWPSSTYIDNYPREYRETQRVPGDPASFVSLISVQSSGLC